MIEKIERRASLELRAAGRKLEGYAAVFNQSTRILDFTETIAPGAFTDTLRENKDILALVDHDASKLLGRTAAGTLKLSQDSKGLAFQIDTPDTTLAKDMRALAERGDIGGASFAFTVRNNGEVWSGSNRELRSLNLFEISVIQSWPAYPGTTVIARARPGSGTGMISRYLETCQWGY
jgi:hypothetical protein